MYAPGRDFYAPGIFGWNGWRWMFMIEAAPAVALGFAVLQGLPELEELRRR